MKSAADAIDTVGAECHKPCGVAEVNDGVNVPSHSGAWSDTMRQGWSVGGSLSGELEATQAAKVAAGVDAAYSEAKETGVTLNRAFPHSGRDDQWRIYTQPVLRA